MEGGVRARDADSLSDLFYQKLKISSAGISCIQDEEPTDVAAGGTDKLWNNHEIWHWVY